MYTRTLN